MSCKWYKGFNPDFTCKGKQYAENTVFEEPEAEVCKSGMHFCKNPFDVLDYYDLVRADGTPNEFAEVEALDEPKTDDHKKFCTKKLKIGVKLGLSGFIKACVDFVLEKTVNDMPDANVNSGYYAKIGSSGNYAKIPVLSPSLRYALASPASSSTTTPRLMPRRRCGSSGASSIGLRKSDTNAQ